MRKINPIYVLALFLTLFSNVRAELEIDIVEGVESTLPIAIVPFRWEGSGPPPEQNVSKIISDDLARSGQFKPLREASIIETPTDGSDIRFTTWRLLKVDNLVIGKVSPGSEGYSVEVQLFDVHTEQRLLAFKADAKYGELRNTAHFLADKIFEAITGVRGAFNTRVAYVTVDQKTAEREYKLMVADADGYNPQLVVRSKQPLLSPSWSKDGRNLAYVSFETGRSNVYTQQLATGNREQIASFKGINGAPSWSPDGTKLAMALSRSGNLEVYVMDVASKRLTQLTNHWSIDTEPAWFPDGKSIVFTSDRSGKPQIYQVDSQGGRARRLTFEGDYNARASVSADGKEIALVHARDNNYRIAILNLESRITRIITPGFLDESPTFAPNGIMVLYATSEADKGVLSAVSSDGRVRQRLVLSDLDVREPAWSSYRSN